VRLNEPSTTPYDLRFSVFRIPVRVHPMFWFMGAILGGTGSGSHNLRPLLIWIGAVFVSVLIHEMGHALAIRALGVQPWITLYGMGGLTSHQGGRFPPTTQILVSLAGPVAGFVFAAIVVLLIKLSGHEIEFEFGFPGLIQWAFGDFTSLGLLVLCNDLLSVNIWWGILNLLPILPLDGGRVTNEVLNICHPRGALQITLWVSVIVATAMAATGLVAHPLQWFRVLLFGSLAYTSFQMLSVNSEGRRG
jgi:stage IV sporulation protein FB